MRARRADTEVRREQIAEAALDLIGGRGLRALSIAAIARRVGFVPSAVYRHFRGKDDVLDAVLDLLRDRLLGNVAAACRESADPVERLHGLYRRHIGLLLENRAIPHVVFSEGLYSGHPERKARVRTIITRYLGEIQRIIRDGQRRGLLRLDVAPRTASLMFLGMILPAAILWNVTDGAFNVRAHARDAWPAFRRALVTGPEGPPQRRRAPERILQEERK